MLLDYTSFDCSIFSIPYMHYMNRAWEFINEKLKLNMLSSKKIRTLSKKNDNGQESNQETTLSVKKIEKRFKLF